MAIGTVNVSSGGDYGVGDLIFYNSLKDMTPITKAVMTAITESGSGWSVGVDNVNGFIYIGHRTSGLDYLKQFSVDDITTPIWSKIISDRAYSIEIDNVGNVWVGTLNGSLYKYNSAGTLLVDIKPYPNGDSILQFDIDDNNNLYVSAYTSKDVKKIDSIGNILWTYTTLGSWGWGISYCKSRDTVFYAMWYGIEEIDSAGNMVNSMALSTSYQPEHIRVDDTNGVLYITTKSAERLRKYTLDLGYLWNLNVSAAYRILLESDSTQGVYLSHISSSSHRVSHVNQDGNILSDLYVGSNTVTNQMAFDEKNGVLIMGVGTSYIRRQTKFKLI